MLRGLLVLERCFIIAECYRYVKWINIYYSPLISLREIIFSPQIEPYCLKMKSKKFNTNGKFQVLMAEFCLHRYLQHSRYKSSIHPVWRVVSIIIMHNWHYIYIYIAQNRSKQLYYEYDCVRSEKRTPLTEKWLDCVKFELV